jgi:putative ABC transport system permease protein
VLAAVGVYGLIAFTVSQRTHEIGIRMAVGASRRDVTRMVVREGAILATIGLALGLAGAAAVTRVLSAVLYGVSPTDPLTFAAVAVLLGLVAAGASLAPARRAAAVDPQTALRAE